MYVHLNIIRNILKLNVNNRLQFFKPNSISIQITNRRKKKNHSISKLILHFVKGFISSKRLDLYYKTNMIFTVIIEDCYRW